MAFQMVDRDQRLARSHGQRLGCNQPDHHPANQTRSGRGSNGIDIGQFHAGVSQHGSDQGGNPFRMGAGSNFGNDPAIRAMGIILRGDTLRHNAALTIHQRSRRFVTGRFNAEDNRHPDFPLMTNTTSTTRA